MGVADRVEADTRVGAFGAPKPQVLSNKRRVENQGYGSQEKKKGNNLYRRRKAITVLILWEDNPERQRQVVTRLSSGLKHIEEARAFRTQQMRDKTSFRKDEY